MPNTETSHIAEIRGTVSRSRFRREGQGAASLAEGSRRRPPVAIPGVIDGNMLMCFNRLQNRESGVSMEGYLSDSEGQRVFIGTSERMRHFAK
jgi:hypothetical protein